MQQSYPMDDLNFEYKLPVLTNVMGSLEDVKL